MYTARDSNLVCNGRLKAHTEVTMIFSRWAVSNVLCINAHAPAYCPHLRHSQGLKIMAHDNTGYKSPVMFPSIQINRAVFINLFNNKLILPEEYTHLLPLHSATHT